MHHPVLFICVEGSRKRVVPLSHASPQIHVDTLFTCYFTLFLFLFLFLFIYIYFIVEIKI